MNYNIDVHFAILYITEEFTSLLVLKSGQRVVAAIVWRNRKWMLNFKSVTFSSKVFCNFVRLVLVDDHENSSQKHNLRIFHESRSCAASCLNSNLNFRSLVSRIGMWNRQNRVFTASWARWNWNQRRKRLLSSTFFPIHRWGTWWTPSLKVDVDLSHPRGVSACEICDPQLVFLSNLTDAWANEEIS